MRYIVDKKIEIRPNSDYVSLTFFINQFQSKSKTLNNQMFMK